MSPDYSISVWDQKSDTVLCGQVETDLIQHIRSDPPLLHNLRQLVQISPNLRLRMHFLLEVPVELGKFSIFSAHR